MSTPNEQDRQLLRAAAEAQLARAPEIEGSLRPAGELLHECRVHETVLEMQIEKLQRNQSALEEFRDLYVNIYGFVPVGYITLTRRGSETERDIPPGLLQAVEPLSVRPQNRISTV